MFLLGNLRLKFCEFRQSCLTGDKTSNGKRSGKNQEK